MMKKIHRHQRGGCHSRHPSRAPTEEKGRGRVKVACAGAESSPDLGQQGSWSSDLQVRNGAAALALWVPAYGRQMPGHASLHPDGSQSLIINPFLCICIFPIDSVSLENPGEHRIFPSALVFFPIVSSLLFILSMELFISAIRVYISRSPLVKFQMLIFILNNLQLHPYFCDCRFPSFLNIVYASVLHYYIERS